MRFSFFYSLLFLLLLVACRPSSNDTKLQGSVLLWHSWQGAAEQTLEGMTKRFEEIYPDIKVITAFVEPSALKDQFELAASLAFGADLLLTPSQDIRNYVTKELIVPLPETVDLTHLLEKALSTTILEGKHYGFPLTINTPVLYYNPKALLFGEEKPVETELNPENPQEQPTITVIEETDYEPASTLAGLLEKANEGERVLIDTNFNKAIWGIRAYGDSLYTEQNQLSIGDGFISWLEWLQESQNSPAVFLSNNSDLLLELFTSGQASYYIGDSNLLLGLRETLGTDLMILPLPSANSQEAAGFLDTEALVLNTMSSEKQQRLAIELANFLTNREQQRRLMRDLNRMPANSQVTIDGRINPVVAVLQIQASSALPRPNTGLNELISLQGNSIYVQVLEGILSPEQALESLQQQFDKDSEDTGVQ